MFQFFSIFFFTQRQYETMHLRFWHWTFVALKKSIFDLNRNMNITIWKKHYAWIVPWASSQLFVPRLNEKSIPGLWIKQRPPFLSSLSPIAIVFTYWLEQNKTNKKKPQRKFINGHFHNAGLNRLVMSNPCWTGLQNGSKRRISKPSALLTPVFTNKPSSPSLHSHSSQSRTILQADVATRTVMYYSSTLSD